RQDDGTHGGAQRSESRARPREGDRSAPCRWPPREGGADPAPDANLLAHPEPDRVSLLGRLVPEAARVPRRPPASRRGDGVPADAAPTARPRLERQPADRLADLPASVMPHGDSD